MPAKSRVLTILARFTGVALAGLPVAASLGPAHHAGAATGPAVCTALRPTAPPVLDVSRTAGLNPEGDTLTVAGRGFDECRGIYIAFCVQPPAGQLPTPCGGGIDIQGNTDASQWISSYPPDYGIGLAVPYGPGGTFSVEVNVHPVINADVDCRWVQCALVARNDHTRTDDRTQDVIVPVLFADAPPATPAPTPAPTEPPATPAPTPAPTTAAPTTPATPAPTTITSVPDAPTTAAPDAATTSTTAAPIAATTSSTMTTAPATTSSTSTSVATSTTAPSVLPGELLAVPVDDTDASGGGGGGSLPVVLGGAGAVAAVTTAGVLARSRRRAL